MSATTIFFRASCPITWLGLSNMVSQAPRTSTFLPFGRYVDDAKTIIAFTALIVPPVSYIDKVLDASR